MQNPHFWEKTVEYAFVLEAARKRSLSFVAPLAGLEEHAAGDAIFGEGDLLFLVEFKVDRLSLSSEEGLFYDYEEAQEKMQNRDGHHFFVYAGRTPQGGQPLPALAAQTYFSGQLLPSAMDCFDGGLHPEIFKEYMQELFDLKKPDGRSSSGQISPDRLANVVGVRADSDDVVTLTLNQYSRMFLGHVPKYENQVRRNFDLGSP